MARMVSPLHPRGNVGTPGVWSAGRGALGPEVPCQLGAGPDPELGVDAGEARLHCPGCDEQLRRHLAVRPSLGDEVGYGLLRGRQLPTRWGPAADPTQLLARAGRPQGRGQDVEGVAGGLQRLAGGALLLGPAEHLTPDEAG